MGLASVIHKDSGKEEVMEQAQPESRSSAGEGAVYLAKDLIGQKEHLWNLCYCEKRKKLVWSTQLTPHALSEADAIGIAPHLKFSIEKIIVFPVALNGMDANHGCQIHHEPIGVGKRIVRIVGGEHLSYLEFLARARDQHLPIFGSSHSYSSPVTDTNIMLHAQGQKRCTGERHANA